MSHEMAAQTPGSEDVISSEEEVRRMEFQELPTPMRKKYPKRPKKGSLKKEQWEGEVSGKMHTDRDALSEIIQRVKAVEQRVLEENTEEVEQDREIPSEAWPDCVKGATKGPKTDLDGNLLLSGKLLGEIEGKRWSVSAQRCWQVYQILQSQIPLSGRDTRCIDCSWCRRKQTNRKRSLRRRRRSC